MPHPPGMTEAALQRAVLDTAALYGWDHMHHADSRRAHAGWPDLVLCRPPRCLFVELKTDRGRVRPDQRRWLQQLAACGLEVGLWRPADLRDRIPAHLGPRNVPVRLPNTW